MNFPWRTATFATQTVWKNDDKSNKLYSSFVEAISETPNLYLSTFGETHSFCLDIVTILHNAVKQELTDMYYLYRAMADLQNSLTLSDLKTSALWFRSFCKFLIGNVLTWHGDVYFPWVLSKVEFSDEDGLRMGEVERAQRGAVEHAKMVYGKQARLSADVSGGANVDVVQAQFLDAVCSSAQLARALVSYFRSIETLVPPLLHRNGVTKEERDCMFVRISKRIVETGHVEIDLPLLVRWMSHPRLRAWIKQYAVDLKNKAIPFWMYNKWQSEHFDVKHGGIVRGFVQRANAE